MNKHTLWLQGDDGGRRSIGKATLTRTAVGAKLRIAVLQRRLIDVEVAAVEDDNVILIRREGLAHYMRMLEQLTYRLLEAKTRQLNVATETADAVLSYGRVCSTGNSKAECNTLAMTVLAVQLKLEKDKRDAKQPLSPPPVPC